VIDAIRRAFSRSKFTIAFKNSRVLSGVKGIRGGKMVKCDVCGKDSPMYTSEVDHIDPVTPVMISGKVMSFSMLFERTFCDVSNLQILCKVCHKIKSKSEMGDRVRWRRLKKWLVCRHQGGSRMEVLGLINLKELEEFWEVLFVSKLKKDATTEMQRRKKL
jgi:hypothetical protein